MSLIYRISFNNLEEQAIQCDIEDMDSGSDTIIPIEGAEDAIRIQTQDNSEDKFTPIKAKKCVIKFLNSQTVNLRTFATGEDNRFLVTVTINALPVFVGWLEQGDIVEPFQYQQNQIVQLTAIDGLAFLKDIRLTDFDGNNPVNENRIIDYICWCLSKTGHAFNINIINNLREERNPGLWQCAAQWNSPDQIVVDLTNVQYFKVGNNVLAAGTTSNNFTWFINSADKSTGEVNVSSISGSVTTETDSGVTFIDTTTYGCMYATLYLDAKTFEDRIGDCINCYDALMRILGHDCFITQAKGEWWIFRIREFRQDFIQYKTTFNDLGVVQSFTTHNYEKAIGLKDVNNTPFAGTPDASAYFSLARTNWLLQRPNKYARLLYNYVNPLEILCNLNFERGTLIGDLPDEIDEDGNTLTVKNYDIQCWEYDRNVPADIQDSAAYIKRRFFNDQEKERYVHMETAANNDFYYLLCLDKIPVELNDKFNLNFSIRYSTDLGGGSGHFQIAQAWVRLYADDGTFWNLHCVSGTGSSNPGSYWQQADGPPNWATFQTFCYQEGQSEDIDFTQWQNLSFEAAGVPRSGKLEILLLNQQNANSQEKDISSLSFEYIPYTNGSYGRYTAQSYKDTQTGEYKPSIEDEVFISNSPHKIFKGSLRVRDLVGDQFEFPLVGFFYEGQEFLFAQDGILNLAAYGDLQVRAFFNQYRNGDETYQAICQGLGEGAIDGDGFDDHQELIHRIFNRDIEPATNNQAFQLVTHDIDLRNCEWTGTMIKNFDTGIGFVLDEIIFKYESDSSNK